jgi:hypothetical protein
MVRLTVGLCLEMDSKSRRGTPSDPHPSQCRL